MAERNLYTNKLILQILKTIIRSGGYLSSYFCLTGMIVLMALDPFMRYIVGSPFFWSNEVTTFLMMLVVFCGFGITLVKEKHIRVTLLFNRFPIKFQNALWIFISLAGLFYVGYLLYALTHLVVSSYKYQVRSETAELLIFPWQIIALCGLLVFLVSMILFTIKRVAIVFGHNEKRFEMNQATENEK
jgi:TRAP-type C4-dicarboxylate transport system permease small subunit